MNFYRMGHCFHHCNKFSCTFSFVVDILRYFIDPHSYVASCFRHQLGLRLVWNVPHQCIHITSTSYISDQEQGKLPCSAAIHAIECISPSVNALSLEKPQSIFPPVFTLDTLTVLVSRSDREDHTEQNERTEQGNQMTSAQHQCGQFE